MTSFYVPPDTRDARVVVRWAGTQISGRELIALRHVVPEFGELGLEEVRRRVGDADGWDLGVLPRGYAEHELMRLATEYGLRLELIDV